MKSNTVVALLFMLCSKMQGQGYLQPQSDQSLFLDNVEISRGKLFSNQLQLRPLDKTNTLDILVKLLANDQSVLTGDSIEIQKLISEHIEVLKLENKDSVITTCEQKPVLRFLYKDGAHCLSIYRKNFQLTFDPLLHFEAGQQDSQTLFINRRGIRIQGSVDQKLFFHSDIIESQMSVPYHVRDYLGLYHALPGAGYYKIYNSKFPEQDSSYDYLLAEACIGFNISKHIQFSFGHGRHFIGSGMRSLLLSDFSAPHFYFKVNTNIWRFHYQNLFTELSAENPSGESNRLIGKKYMAAHYLGINLTKKWNAGIFESVVFARDHGFELQYLNPVILYRAVEHSLGSPDNVMIGFHSNLLVGKKFSFYGQLMLDEFLFGEFFKSGGWWGNKFGFQLGAKYANAFAVDNLFLQLEYNQVRPFTYTFRDSISNYTHYHQALAHPLGANFRELIFSLSYRPSMKWSLSANLFYFQKGMDSLGLNEGGNILLDYTTRRGDYGHETGQGISTKVFSGRLSLSYQLFFRSWLEVNLYYRKTNQQDASTWFTAGFRMNLDQLKIDF